MGSITLPHPQRSSHLPGSGGCPRTPAQAVGVGLNTVPKMNLQGDAELEPELGPVLQPPEVLLGVGLARALLYVWGLYRLLSVRRTTSEGSIISVSSHIAA